MSTCNCKVIRGKPRCRVSWFSCSTYSSFQESVVEKGVSYSVECVGKNGQLPG